MIAAIPPAALPACADGGPAGACAGGSPEHTQPTLFAITTTDSSDSPMSRQMLAHCGAESFGNVVDPEVPTGAVHPATIKSTIPKRFMRSVYNESFLSAVAHAVVDGREAARIAVHLRADAVARLEPQLERHLDVVAVREA